MTKRRIITKEDNAIDEATQRMVDIAESARKRYNLNLTAAKGLAIINPSTTNTGK